MFIRNTRTTRELTPFDCWVYGIDSFPLTLTYGLMHNDLGGKPGVDLGSWVPLTPINSDAIQFSFFGWFERKFCKHFSKLSLFNVGSHSGLDDHIPFTGPLGQVRVAMSGQFPAMMTSSWRSLQRSCLGSQGNEEFKNHTSQNHRGGSRPPHRVCRCLVFFF